MHVVLVINLLRELMLSDPLIHCYETLQVLKSDKAPDGRPLDVATRQRTPADGPSSLPPMPRMPKRFRKRVAMTPDAVRA